ncbi:hypothetical protein ASG84_11345 [Rhodococcus sp. Leaf278]|nr:hypothetical protein ASG84_11345 [Rhodococcus sp. Leaf278]
MWAASDVGWVVGHSYIVYAPLKGHRPSAYVVLKSDATIDTEVLRDEIVQMVRDKIGAVAAFRDLTVVDGLPKTRSGKILRKVMRHITAGERSN